MPRRAATGGPWGGTTWILCQILLSFSLPFFEGGIEICGVDHTSMCGLTLANCTLPIGFCAQGEGVRNMALDLSVDDALGSLE